MYRLKEEITANNITPKSIVSSPSFSLTHSRTTSMSRDTLKTISPAPSTSWHAKSICSTDFMYALRMRYTILSPTNMNDESPNQVNAAIATASTNVTCSLTPGNSCPLTLNPHLKSVLTSTTSDRNIFRIVNSAAKTSPSPAQ
ncbi:hypothetical protein DSO57_1032253 [Entomophthora muscae]|uniref:Uncharacterized protein n=1 Tax=Entomophthora muscae TaxID=34485 RepID=A0ACC2RRH5_9FUNG|nr:hypothetical protein DSO57_1032253 [Entomophthora muscae]